MGWFKSKSKPEDIVFSRFIRIRDGFKCVKCGRQHVSRINAKGETVCDTLDNSHFHGRRYWGTRFDPENCDSLCKIPCHEKWENEKGEGREYYEFKKKQLGERRFLLLQMRAETPTKKDRKLALLKAKALLEGITRHETVFGSKA